MNVEAGTLRLNIAVAVIQIFPLVVPFPYAELSPAVRLISDNAPVCFCDYGFPLSDSFLSTAYQDFEARPVCLKIKFPLQKLPFSRI